MCSALVKLTRLTTAHTERYMLTLYAGVHAVYPASLCVASIIALKGVCFYYKGLMILSMYTYLGNGTQILELYTCIWIHSVAMRGLHSYLHNRCSCRVCLGMKTWVFVQSCIQCSRFSVYGNLTYTN